VSANTEIQISQESLQALTIAQIRELASERLGMTMPLKWSKPQIIEAVLFQALPAADDDEPEGEPEIPNIPDVTDSNPIPSIPDIAAIDTLASGVQTAIEMLESQPREESETPELSEEPEKLSPNLTRDEVAAKLAAHRARIAGEQVERDAAAAEKPRYQPWQPTEAELLKRAGKIGYSIGSLLFAYNRLRKETKILAQVLEAMGELADEAALRKAKNAIIGQFAHNKDRACFPSAALDSAMKGDELREAVWQEIIAVGVPLQVAQLLGDQPVDVSAPFIDPFTASDDDELEGEE
jgi:hypothetical protein